MTEMERCRPWIEDALEYSGGTHTFEDVAAGIASARMQLWPAPRGCAVTELVLYPQKKVLHVFLAGGDMDQLFEMIEDAAEWGRGQGCGSMTLAGRFGWQRAMKHLGWEPTMIVMGREI
jgi:hypothetical protein